MGDWNLDHQYLAELVVRAKQGDSDAFAELYLATYKKIYRFACQYLRDEELAQDAMQETYVIMLRKLHTLKDPKLFVSWLNQVVFRVCFSARKRDARRMETSMYSLEYLEDEVDEAYQPENIMVEVDEKNFVIRQIMGLPFSESQVIILHYYNNMKIREIAKLLEISQSTVKRYLSSGKQKLGLLINR